MRHKPYKEQIKFLAHKHRDTIDEISKPSFYYYNPVWPEFILTTSDHYQHPVRKVFDDIANYRNSFAFQKDKTFMAAVVAQEGELAC